MIPKQAIEKAKKGGWIDPKRNDVPTIYLHSAIALDPSFWQALGKALGWPNEELTDIGLLPGWHHEAIAFCHLILTGGDTDKFWEEILK